MKKIYGSRKIRQMAETRSKWYGNSGFYGGDAILLTMMVIFVIIFCGIIWAANSPKTETHADVLYVEVSDDVNVHRYKNGAYYTSEEVPCKHYYITLRVHNLDKVITAEFMAENTEQQEYADAVFQRGNTIAYHSLDNDAHVIEEGS